MIVYNSIIKYSCIIWLPYKWSHSHDSNTLDKMGSGIYKLRLDIKK